MNLKKYIRKVLKEHLDEAKVFNEGANPSVEFQIKNSLERHFNDIKGKYKQYLDQSKNIIDPYKIIDKFKNYLVSRTPDVINQLKTGTGGAKFAYDSYLFVKNLVQEEMNNMGTFKKGSIKLLVKDKEFLRNKMNQEDISDFISLFSEIVDFGFMVGWMDEMKKYEDNTLKWEKENYDWVNKNQKFIKSQIINTIISGLYS
jgi:hypothetical protein